MKSYKELFVKKGFVFNGKSYNYKSYSENYFNLVKDILDGIHGRVPEPETLTDMFGKTIWINYDDMPEGVRERKAYKQLGDIYILGYKSVTDFNIIVKRISENMKKDVIFS